MNSTQVFEKRKIAVAIGIDLAKDHCDVVAYNADNKICFTKANMTYPKLRSEISRNWVKQDGKSADMRVSAFRIHVRRGAPWFHARLAPSFCC